jgi:activator of 2-hydroxyglutaryl-CoA dehydratase
VCFAGSRVSDEEHVFLFCPDTPLSITPESKLLKDEVVFAGGCAYNPCLKSLLEQSLGRNISVASVPELTVALGAALFTEEDECSW